MRHALLAVTALCCCSASLPAFAQAREWRVYPAMRQGEAVYAVATDAAGKIVRCDTMDGSPDTIAAVQACGALTTRGIPAGLEPARSASDPAGWVTAGDYPVGAGNAGASVKVAFEVDESGRIADCRAHPASSNAPFEAAACAALVARARFTPARYNGQPTRAVAVRTVQFPAR